MKNLKILGLLVVAAAALMAFAGSASATTFTSPTGTPLGVGTVIKAESLAPHITIHGTTTHTCEKSTREGQITNAGGKHANGETTTVEVKITKLTLEKCGNNTLTVIAGGTMIYHSLGSNKATITWNGLEITTLSHNILGTVHCIYRTNNTDFGVLIGSSHMEAGNSQDEVESNEMPEVATDTFACKEGASLTGSYRITSPVPLYVD